MSPLKTLLHDLIGSHGPLDIASYMTLALTHPRHGYYAKGNPFGSIRDFTTAPEISQVFGELIGLCLADFWLRSGRPAPFRLVELGPGRGALMADLLRATKLIAGFHEASSLHLVEINAALRAAQADLLANVASSLNPRWHASLNDVDDGGPLLLVANEFLDVLPIRQFERRGAGLRERRIGLDRNNELAFVLDPRTAVPEEIAFGTLAEGAVVETSPARSALVGDLAARLGSAGGMALLIDYAHEPESTSADAGLAVGDTLQAIYRGERVSALSHPGDADLTARVDFQALRRVADQAGLQTHGPIGQGEFLRNLGIEARRRQLVEASPQRTAEMDRAVARLIDQDRMGRLFQVLALTAAGSPTPEGMTESGSRG